MDWMKLRANIAAVIANIRSTYNGLDRNRKVIFLAGLALLLTAVIYLAITLTRPKFVPLYTNLSEQDAGAITQYLKDKKVPYRLSDAGTTILVPEAEKYQLRLDLANNNLPNDNIVGFESFDQTRFGETESEQKIRYMVALQGELERTIKRIEGVEDVRVHIVIPETTLFVEDQKSATAAVLVKLKPGYRLDDAQVQGITHLVASGVEGLKPENVNVLDSRGNILSGGDSGEQSIGRLTDSQLGVKQNYEKQLEKEIQSMLEQVVGPGRVVVRANADLDFDQVQIDKENYGNKQVRSSHTIEESTQGATSQGEAGTGTNIPTYQQATGSSSGGTQRTEKTTNYELDKQTERRVVAPGKVKSLSLSVVIDGRMDSQQQQEIENMVASAAGINTRRGDKLTVTCMPFNRDEANQLAKEMAAETLRHRLLTLAWVSLIIIAAIGLLLYLRKILLKRVQQNEQLAAVEEVLAARRQEMAESTSDERAELLQQLRQLAQNNPADTIEVLRSWLNGD